MSLHLSKKNIQVNGASPRLPSVCPGTARVGWLGFTSVVFKHVVLSRSLVGSLLWFWLEKSILIVGKPEKWAVGTLTY